MLSNRRELNDVVLRVQRSDELMSVSYETTLATETKAAFDAYVAEAESGMQQAWRAGVRLWSAMDAKRERKIHAGEAAVEMWSGTKPRAVPHGLVHDLIGAVFVPGATVKQALALLQDYDNHQKIYSPDVIASKVLNRQKDHFNIYLRLLKKKVITVVLDTEHDVQYTALDNECWTCWSYTTRIAEVLNPGAANESVLPPDTGHGFMWRLNSYWTVQGHDTGATIECRAISLTRDIPFALRLVIQPIVRSLPSESLESTLRATQRAILATLLSGSRE